MHGSDLKSIGAKCTIECVLLLMTRLFLILPNYVEWLIHLSLSFNVNQETLEK